MAREQQRQEENDVLRKQFAQAANAFHQWLTDTRYNEQLTVYSVQIQAEFHMIWKTFKMTTHQGKT